jgi:c(7)-type cytochrome triheme protein
VDALERGLVDPRARLEGGGEMAVLNLDIIMTRTKNMPYVRFPHEAHTRWLTCSNCHPRIFKPRAGGNPVTMDGILLGAWCGVCHGRVAFPLMDCTRCHNVPRVQTGTD